MECPDIWISYKHVNISCVYLVKFEHYPTQIYIAVHYIVRIIYATDTSMLNDFLPFTLKMKIYLGYFLLSSGKIIVLYILLFIVLESK
jgi:hypothetical protein